MLKQHIELAREFLEILGMPGKFVRRHQQKESVGKPVVHGETAGGPDFADAGNLLQAFIRWAKKIPCADLDFASVQSTQGSETSMATIWATRKPGFTSRHFLKLRPSRPAVVAPMASASVSTETEVNPGLLRNSRRA